MIPAARHALGEAIHDALCQCRPGNDLGIHIRTRDLEHALPLIEAALDRAGYELRDRPKYSESIANALEWIRRMAAWHYIGGAFEPEHMREIANLATDALNGVDVARPASAEEIQTRGEELHARLLPFTD